MCCNGCANTKREHCISRFCGRVETSRDAEREKGVGSGGSARERRWGFERCRRPARGGTGWERRRRRPLTVPLGWLVNIVSGVRLGLSSPAHLSYGDNPTDFFF
jgi:hypothetical protein